MNNIAALEHDIRDKIEHAFDIKHIYSIFATLVSVMNEQQSEIVNLKNELGTTNLKCKELAASIKTMEYNIQGFQSQEEEEEYSHPIVSSSLPITRRSTSDTSFDTHKYTKPSQPRILEVSTPSPFQDYDDEGSLGSMGDGGSVDSFPEQIRLSTFSVTQTQTVAPEISAEDQPRRMSTIYDRPAPMKALRNSVIIDQEEVSDSPKLGQASNFSRKTIISSDEEIAESHRSSAPEIVSTKSLRADVSILIADQQHPASVVSRSRPSVKETTEEEISDAENESGEQRDQFETPDNATRSVINEVIPDRVLQASSRTSSRPLSPEGESHREIKPEEMVTFEESINMGDLYEDATVSSRSRASSEPTYPALRPIHPIEKIGQGAPLKEGLSFAESMSEVPLDPSVASARRSRRGEKKRQSRARKGVVKVRNAEDAERWKQLKLKVLRRVYQRLTAMNSFVQSSGLSVSKSKLDPKLSVNNRLRYLEDQMRATAALVSAHRKALDSLPAKIKSVVPPDIKTQLNRLTKVLDQLEGHSNQKSSLSRGFSFEEDVTEDQMKILVGRVQAMTPAPSAPFSIEPSALQALVHESVMKQILSVQVVEKIAHKMLDNNFLDELRGSDPTGRRRGTSGDDYEEMVRVNQTKEIVENMTVEFIQRAELNSIYDLDVDSRFDQTERQPDAMIEPGTPDKTSRFVPLLTEPIVKGGGREVGLSNPLVSPSRKAAAMFITPLTMSERFKLAIEQNVQLQLGILNLDSVKKSELDDRLRNVNAAVSIEVGRSAKEFKSELEVISTVFREKNARMEKSLNDNAQSLATLEAALRSQMADMERSKAVQERHDRAWKPEIDKVNLALTRSLGEQKDLSKKLLEDLAVLKTEIEARADEKRLEELVLEIDMRISRGVIDTVDPVRNIVASIVRAIRSKADRTEMERIINMRIAETEANLKRLEQEHEAAAGTRCLSCGSASNARTSPHLLNDPSVDSHISAETSWGANQNISSDYEVMMAVMHREAGLKPLSRHTKPMLPVSHRPFTASQSTPTTSMSSTAKEPLYRRAKHVNQLKEVPKIPLVNFGPSHDSPAAVYHLDGPKAKTQSNNVQLPRVSSAGKSSGRGVLNNRPGSEPQPSNLS